MGGVSRLVAEELLAARVRHVLLVLLQAGELGAVAPPDINTNRLHVRLARVGQRHVQADVVRRLALAVGHQASAARRQLGLVALG